MEQMAPRKLKPVSDRVVCSVSVFRFSIFLNSVLQEDLYAAIRATQENANLSTYNAALPNAPNPCMRISGTGLVPLPLTGKDAKGIGAAASAAQADDQGASTTRGYWEISRDGVLFGNLKFEAYLEAKVLPPLADQLGLDWGAKSVPNLSFEKLVLCESDFWCVPAFCMDIVIFLTLSSYSLPPCSTEQNQDGEIVLGRLLVLLPSRAPYRWKRQGGQ